MFLRRRWSFARSALLGGVGALLLAAGMAALALLRGAGGPEPPAPILSAIAPEEEQVVAGAALELTLWAEAPLVRNPASIDIDARGRVWVAEAVNYRDRANGLSQSPSAAYHPQGDRIVILEDADGDGRADKSTVFAQDRDLVAPLGICVLGRRVYVSCSPHVLVFIDDDGDDRADRKEVFLTGFGGADHDHGVHSVIPGPDGRLYLTAGNAGPHQVTDRTGWTLRAGSCFQTGLSEVANSGGLRSDDGEIYVGGVALKIRPDGRDLAVIGHNFRNPYEIAIDSLGDVWQTDNDDTASCRMTWLMERGNLGFFSADGRRTWPEDRRPGQSHRTAHWRQEDPGVLPAGDIYGAGAPTGLVRYEGDALGPALRGAVLACDAGLGCVFAYRPLAAGAGFRFERRRLIWSQRVDDSRSAPATEGSVETWFRPTDIAISPAGDLFVSDWFDSYVGAHRVADEAAAGRIFRVRSRETRSTAAPHFALHSSASPSSASDAPPLDLATDAGRIAAFQSASPHVRWLAREALKDAGAAAVGPLRPLLDDPNPFVRARTLWLLAELAPEGRKLAAAALGDPDPAIRVAAVRALRSAGVPAVDLAAQMYDDPAAPVRREVALALRGLPFNAARPFLLELAAQFDGEDRYYLEALGMACQRHAEALYPELRARLGGPPEDWSPAFSRLVWRLHPQAALDDLAVRVRSRRLAPEERRRMIDALAFAGGEAARKTLASLANDWRGEQRSSTQRDAAMEEYVAWWVRHLTQTPTSPEGESTPWPQDLSVARPPHSATVQVDHARVEAISRMPGDWARGRRLFASPRILCIQCHRFGAGGGALGPELTEIRQRLSRKQLIEAILYPSAAILTGYESWTVTDTRGRTATGLLVGLGDTVRLRAASGDLCEIPRRQVEELRYQPLSLMPEFSSEALSDQEAADLAAYLLAGDDPSGGTARESRPAR